MKNFKLPTFGSAVYVFLCIAASIMFLAASKKPKPQYSPYQILVWEIKANEGYRSWWYRDGTVQNRPAHSIGFGWNDCGNRRRKEIKQYTQDGKVTFNEAMIITMKEIAKYGTLHRDPYRNVALQLYSYNCGLTSDGNRLGRCCGAKWGCGSAKKNVRKAHNIRRKFELALWRHDYDAVCGHTEANQRKLQRLIVHLKENGQL